MANIAVQRIKREFKEVLKSEEVRFITKIWHPNISSVTGAICLDILKDQWAAAMTLRTVLLSLQALLAAAEPDDPQDAVVANQYKQNPEMFKQTARLWAHVYAGAPVSSPEYTKKIENLCAMGFDRSLLEERIHDSQCKEKDSFPWDVITLVLFLTERSNSGLVFKIMGCRDCNRTASE
ncbi:ubiquitin-conjugating enzyme E2 K isoform X3 [Acomys russatus]|uniref:ubiquitin-conjugating enzyme E2 K isoform X3 n=1 Tax=Acomys russatus TaxID=60746 RepID=UPI0021E25CAA|nr:ubiquitin-conjugating enzyme E2 K isoform X3 [Acomys russatus]